MLSAAWLAALADPLSRKFILVTISISGRLQPPGADHPALQSGAFCFSTHPDVTMLDPVTGVRVPFWPWVLAWPTGIDYRVSLTDRRVEIPQIGVQLSAGATLPPHFLGRGGIQAALCRIDLATDAVTLGDVIVLAQGQIQQPVQDQAGGISFSVSDGPANPGASFPPGLLTVDAFPDAPAAVAGVMGRQEIFGPIPEHAPAWPIDHRDDPTLSRTFYFTDSPSTPQTFYKGGEVLPVLPTVDRARDAMDGEYTRITLPRPIADYHVGINNDLTCSGGMGRQAQGVLLDLCDLAGYALAPQTRALFAAQSLSSATDLSVIVNTPTSIESLLFERLLPQTTLLATWRGGRIHAWDMSLTPPQLALGIGTGLRDSITRSISATADSAVANDFSLRCGRTLGRSTGTSVDGMVTVRRTAHTPGPVGELLAQSQLLVGRRPFVSGSADGIDAADLIVLTDADGKQRCPAGEALGDHLARLYALPHRAYVYPCEWLKGVVLQDLLWECPLTDAAQGLDAVSSRVVGWALPDGAGPIVTVLTRDTDA